MSPETFFAQHPPEIEALCLRLRALVRDVLPDMEEVVFPGWKNVSYGTGQSRADRDLICYIAPHARRVNLGLYRGARLPDPAGLMTGTGKLLRHVPFVGADAHDEAAVRALLVAAREERTGQAG